MSLTADAFTTWLDAYGKAWTNGDPAALERLFSGDARYYETPFDQPMSGLSQIQQYWQDGAQDAQVDVVFQYQIITTDDSTGWACWQATFTRKSNQVRVELDGTLAATFSDDGLCTEFREWWHRHEHEQSSPK